MSKATKVTIELSHAEVDVFREALDSLWNREYRESRGPRGGHNPTPLYRACEKLQIRLQDVFDAVACERGEPVACPDQHLCRHGIEGGGL